MDSYYNQGRVFQNCHTFFEDEKANEFMAKNPNTGVLFAEKGFIIITDLDNKGEPHTENELFKYLKLADAYNALEIHQGDLWLYFKNEQSFNKALNIFKNDVKAEAFKSPAYAPNQLAYTIKISTRENSFTQGDVPKRLKNLLSKIGVGILEIAHYKPSTLVAKTSLDWPIERVQAILDQYNAQLPKEHKDKALNTVESGNGVLNYNKIELKFGE